MRPQCSELALESRHAITPLNISYMWLKGLLFMQQFIMAVDYCHRHFTAHRWGLGHSVTVPFLSLAWPLLMYLPQV